MIEQLTLGTTIVIALITGGIAWRANRISSYRINLESDKLLLDWGKRCVIQISRVISLRLLDPEEINAVRFAARRREHRAELYACISEGRLLLDPANGDAEELKALLEIAAMMSFERFPSPAPGDYDSRRRPQSLEIDAEQSRFIKAMQTRLADQWTH